MALNSFDPKVQTNQDGALTEAFRKRIVPVKDKHGLSYWDFAGLSDPRLSGSWLGNLARYPGLKVSTALANGLHDLVQELEALEPGSSGFRAVLDRHRIIKSLPEASQSGEARLEERAAASPNPPTRISIEDAVRALRDAGFSVTLTAI